MVEFCADTNEFGIMAEVSRTVKQERNMITGCQMGGVEFRSSDPLGKLPQRSILIENEAEDNIGVTIEVPSRAFSLQAGARRVGSIGSVNVSIWKVQVLRLH